MKTRTILFFLLLLTFSNIYSQKISNLKFTDIYGNDYQSSEITSDGQYILFDFFTTGCTSCHDWVPIIDSLHEVYGCSCGDMFFAGMNLYENSTDEQVFNFTQDYGMNFTPVSADGGSYQIGQILGAPWTPYLVIIDTQHKVVFDSTLFISKLNVLLDTIDTFNLTPSICQGTNFKYYELRNNTDSFPGVVDLVNKIITVDIPAETNLDYFIPFFISDSKSTSYIEEEEQISNETVVDFSEQNVVYTNIAEDETISIEWTVNLNLLTKNEDFAQDIPILYPNPTKGIVYLRDYTQVEQMNIYSIDGKLISNIKPSRNDQDFSILGQGTFLISIQSEGKVFNQKIVIE